MTWIKNYIELDDPGKKFRRLSWADQGRLQALWRLAARLGKDGHIPYDEQYLRSVLGDKRFTFGGQMLPEWFHIGTQKELKTAAKREDRSRKMPQDSSLRVRVKSKSNPPTPLEGGPDLPGKKEMRQYTGCRQVYNGRAPHWVRDPLGTSKAPESWPHEKPSAAEVMAALAERNAA